MSRIEKEKLIKADIASIENRVRHAFNQGYDLGFKDGKEKAKPLEQETQTFKWCETCKEYDQEKHCCHRWSKVIRDTAEEMKQEQEPILDKIRAEIEQIEINGHIRDVECFRAGINIALNVIDKYKAESEST